MTSFNELTSDKSSSSFRQNLYTSIQDGETSHATISCSHCTRMFMSQIQLNRHLQYVKARRDIQCPIQGCDRAFAFQSHLSAHLAMHMSRRAFVCDFANCTYRGRTASQLTQHKASHGIGYKYACEFCEYKATTSSNLRRHARLHSAARPYLCPHCPHRTVELNALRRHVLDSAHHPGLPLYVCPWCSQASRADEVIGFNASGLAWRHVTQAHMEELSRPQTMLRLGRKPGEILCEHDVSLIFGLYHPDRDTATHLRTHLRRVTSTSESNPTSSTCPSILVVSNSYENPPTSSAFIESSVDPTHPSNVPISSTSFEAPWSSSQSTFHIASIRCLRSPNSRVVPLRLEASQSIRTSGTHDPAVSSSFAVGPVELAKGEDLIELPGGVIWSLKRLQSTVDSRPAENAPLSNTNP